MKKNTLGILAVVLITLMVVVVMAGFDNLPRDLRKSIDAASTGMQADRSQFEDARRAINHAISSEPELFRTQAALWQNSLAQTDDRLRKAEAEVKSLRELEKANRRGDAGKVRQELGDLDSLRSGTVQQAQNLRAETERWLNYKRNLPSRLASMRSDYEALHAFVVAQHAPNLQKAVVDWPGKKADLDKRLGTLENLKKQGEEAWTTTAGERTKAEAKDLRNLDYAALFAAGEAISNDLRELQHGTESLNVLANQLYMGRDKVLLALDDDHGAKEKVRVVETKYADASLANPQTSSREEWQDVSSGRMNDLKHSIGMVVERKQAGKYDSEAERNIQPPGYAYIAPPGQSNQYGAWQNGVWQWLPQYLILSQLLRTTTVPTISTGDYYDFDRARRRGEIWYGRSGEYGSTWSRNSGTSRTGGGTISSGSTRPKESWNTGGSTFGGSKYESRGTFGGSRYQSRPSTGSGSFGSRSYSRGTFSRGFGRGGRR